MVISKNATKLMAFVLTAAFVLMGLAYVPKEAQAAEVTDVPTVRVLGATLRLDNEVGAQSLRLAIEVSKASLAKACGIIITSKETNMTVTIATDVNDGTDENGRTKRHTEMYSIDTDNDKVVYSAVITGIPIDKFDKWFDVKGYVKAVDTVEEDKREADSGEPVIKSVKGVVEALQEIDDSIEMDMETGRLVRKDEEGNSKELESNDPVFGGDMLPTPLVINASITDIPSNEVDVNSSVILGVSVEKSHDAQIKSVDWSVSGGAVIEQDAADKTKAEVTAVKAGKATVYATVTASDGQQTVTGTAVAEIQIKQPSAPEKLVINPSITGVTAEEKNVGDKVELGISLDKGNVEIKSVDWSVRGGAAVIEPDGADKKKAVVTAVSGGKATVYATVTASDGEQTATGTATAEITVKEQQIQEPLEVSATITGGSSQGIDINDEVKLTVSVDKNNVEIESVDWSVSGGVVIKQDAADKTKAVATAVNAGNATVYATVTVKEKAGERTATDTAKYAITVNKQPDPTPAPTPLVVNPNIKWEAPLSLDLSDAGSYRIDGDGTSAQWNNGALDVIVGGYQGVIFKNPAENIEGYKYVTVTYTSKNSLNAYIFDGQMGSNGVGKDPAGQVGKDNLNSTDTDVTVTYEADKSMYGFKIVRFNSASSFSVKSVVFSRTAPNSMMKVNETDVLDVSVDKGTIEDVEWSVYGGAAVIAKDANNKEKAAVTAVKGGTATVIAKVTVKDGKQTATGTATIEVNVKEPLKINANITGASSKDININDTVNLTASVNQGNIKSVEWSVSGGAAVIEQDGNDKTKAVVTAVKAGTVTVSAKVTASHDGQTATETDTVEINVKAAPEITATIEDIPQDGVEANNNFELGVSVDKGNIKSVEWSLSDKLELIRQKNTERIVVYAVRGGIATATAKVTVSYDGRTVVSTATAEIRVLLESGFNEDGTEYTLPLNSGTVSTANGWENPDITYDYNDEDGSVKITRGENATGCIGICVPKDIYSRYRFAKAIITYSDSTNTDVLFNYTVKYNCDHANWTGDEEDHNNWNYLSDEGTAEITPNYNSDKNARRNFSSFRLTGGSAGAVITIKSIVFVTSEGYVEPGFNEDETEYTLPLNKDTFGKVYGWDADCYTYNEDGSVTINVTAHEWGNYEFGAKIPENVYTRHRFTKAIITYENSSNTDYFGCAVKYDANNLEGDVERHDRWSELSGAGTVEIFPYYSGEDSKKNFSGFKLYGGTAGASITIKSIVFVVADEYILPLNEDTVWTNTGNLIFNKDGTMTITRNNNSEFGFQLPKEIYSEHKFKTAIIEYKNSTAESDKGFNCTKYYDRDRPYDMPEGSKKDIWGIGSSLSGELGKAWIPICDQDDEAEKKFSGFKLWSGTNDASITFTKITFIR